MMNSRYIPMCAKVPNTQKLRENLLRLNNIKIAVVTHMLVVFLLHWYRLLQNERQKRSESVNCTFAFVNKRISLLDIVYETKRV